LKATIADLGIGNLHSLAKALERCGATVSVTPRPADWLSARVLVLPGVGAFGAGMRALQPVQESVRSRLESGVPALGVCLGLQLLCDASEESPAPGVGFIGGKVRRFPPEVGKVPHIGWSRVESKDPLFAGLPPSSYFYFVHSYYPAPDENVAVASTTHGIPFASALRKGNTYATQFHPEKSGPAGLKLLSNFLAFAEAAQ
jgi:glutamine amidotransferase